MCVSYISPDEADIERNFRIHTRGAHTRTRRSTAAPTNTVPILELAVDEGYALSAARWGLIPQWWKQDRAPDLTFNALSEEAASKSMWRQAYRHNRCLIPAEGWFQWQNLECVGLDSQALHKARQRRFVCSRHDPIMAFAGLMAVWRNEEGERVVSCAVLTKAAARNLANLHPRMPVVVAPRYYEEWLNPASPTDLERIIAEARTGFVHYPAGTPHTSNTRDEASDGLPQNSRTLA